MPSSSQNKVSPCLLYFCQSFLFFKTSFCLECDARVVLEGHTFRMYLHLTHLLNPTLLQNTILFLPCHASYEYPSIASQPARHHTSSHPNQSLLNLTLRPPPIAPPTDNTLPSQNVTRVKTTFQSIILQICTTLSEASRSGRWMYRECVGVLVGGG